MPKRIDHFNDLQGYSFPDAVRLLAFGLEKRTQRISITNGQDLTLEYENGKIESANLRSAGSMASTDNPRIPVFAPPLRAFLILGGE